MRRRLWGALVVGWCLSISSAALADPPPTEAEKQAQVKFEAAKTAFEAAKTAPDKTKKIEEALSLFQEAAALNRAAGTVRNIALCEEELGRLASAWTHSKEALALYPPNHKRVPEVKQLIDKLEPRVPKLRIRPETGVPSDTKVYLGEREVQSSEMDQNMPLDPGAYTIRVEAKGHVTRTYEVRLGEGESKTLEVGVGRFDFQPSAPVVPPPVPTSEPPKPFPTKKALTVGLGVGALGLLGTGAGLLVALEWDKQKQRELVDRLKANKGPAPCSPPSSTQCQYLQYNLDLIDTLSKVGPSLMAVGGVTAALTIWLAVDPGSKLGTFLGVEPRKTPMVPYFTEKEAGVILRGDL